MLIGILHRGSGIGDQLFSYIATRVKALELGVDFGFVGKEFFKGGSFMPLDWGEEVALGYFIEEPAGKLVIAESHNLFEFNKPYYDPEWNFITDGTVIDGYGAQDERYWGHRLDEIREWLKIDGIESHPFVAYSDGQVDYKEGLIDNHVCILNMRGGEYRGISDLFLPKEYWDKGIDLMKDKHFEIHSDDDCFKQWFPDFPLIKNIGINWYALRYAKNAIISNSAFAIIPRLLAHLDNPAAITIAPFGWNAKNASFTKWMGRPQNYYKKFTYI